MDIAKAAGINREKARKLKNDPDFQAVLTERRTAIVSNAVDRMNQYMTENVEILQRIIRSDETAAQTRVNAIQVFLNQLQAWTTTTDILRRLDALEAKTSETGGAV